MKKSPHKMAHAPGARKVAVSLFVSSAVGLLAAPVHAQQVATPASAPVLAITKPAPPPAESLETPRVQVFRSDPTLSAGVTSAPSAPTVPASTPGLAAGAGEPLDLSPAVAVTKPRAEDMPDVLDPNLRVWPLPYAEPSPLNALYFSLPTEKEARIMLPGHASDVASRARYTVSRYVTDNIGSSGQVRGRQLEAFATWRANHDKQKQSLPKDAWAAYQFSVESHEVVAQFKEKIAAQTAPELERMVREVNDGVVQISAVMEAAGAYEMKLQWYNVLVQLKEGVGLYQARVAEADGQVLSAIADFESSNPRVTRPEGAPPRRVSGRAAPVGELTAPVVSSTMQARDPAKPVPTQEAPSQAGGIVILFGFAAVVFGLFMKLRKRVAGKGSAKKSSAE